MSNSLASDLRSEQTDPRSKQLAYDTAIKIALEVIRRAKEGDKKCLKIFSDAAKGAGK